MTAAHRVVWTWMNEFAPLLATPPQDDHSTGSNNNSKQVSTETVDQLQVGDLVTMTIVDVFETDNQGKLLSYCPTFDNRAIHKTHQTAETLRKSTHKLLTVLHKAQKSKLAKLIVKQAQAVAHSLKQRVDQAVHNYNHAATSSSSPLQSKNSMDGYGHMSGSVGDGSEFERHEV